MAKFKVWGGVMRHQKIVDENIEILFLVEIKSNVFVGLQQKFPFTYSHEGKMFKIRQDFDK